MNPIDVAVRGKGSLNTLKRIGMIGRRYGWTSGKMDRTLAHFVGILDQFDCAGTFPITGAALARSRGVVERHQETGIEFAVHGYYHVDHARLSLDQQLAYLAEARRLFEDRGVACHGFRCPYLRQSEATTTAVGQSGFLYDSSQSLAWPVVDGLHTEAYQQVLDFYGAISAEKYPSLPRIENAVVEIPYSLPDDEALTERLRRNDAETMGRLWRAILEETYRLGELFTLGLHPERIYLCELPLKEVLYAAGLLSPGVWIARLDEVARWWTARAETRVAVDSIEAGELSFSVLSPEGVAILARGVEALTPVVSWDGVYQQVIGSYFRFRSLCRPFIGVSISSSPELVSLLRQQGYIVELAADGRDHTYFLDRPRFSREDERPILMAIEQGDFPLVRLGRWPNGARSALCITGDIDALTFWDYGLRFLGR